MTKVIDLFRHRSNSSVSEAEKRKAVSLLTDQKLFFSQRHYVYTNKNVFHVFLSSYIA